MSVANIAELKSQHQSSVPAIPPGTGKMVAKDVGGSTVANFFDANKAAIKAVLPQHMTPDRMCKIALRAMQTTPKLMQCTVNSLFGAVISCAQLGLEPNTPQGHIYLIPFENKRKGTTEVQVIIGYKGLIDLARRSGQIVSISSHAVRENDLFDVDFGTEESIKHKPRLDGERGEITGFYAVAKLKDGGTQFEYMSRGEVDRIRNDSQGYKTALRFAKEGQPLNTPWATNYEEMGRKTAIRRLCKYLPMSIEMANAIELDHRADVGLSQNMDAVLDGEFNVVDEPISAIDHAPDAIETEAISGTSPADQSQLSDLAAKGLADLQAAKTKADLDSVWEHLDIATCRELGPSVLDDLRKKFN